MTHLLEREPLLDTLQALLAAAIGGAGQVALVAGEAGIGKTSLMATLREHCRGTTVWWGACDALQTPHPLAPLHDIARSGETAFRALLAGEADRAGLFEAVLSELKRAPLGTLFVVEDAHWGDEATLDLLKFVGRRMQQVPCLLVVTYRDDEVTAGHPLRRLIGELPQARLTHLRLPRLSEGAVEAMARGALHSHDGIYVLTQGNPFFVTEVLRHGIEGVPRGVQDLVLARYARLEPAAQEIVQLASIVPRRIERWLVDAVLHPPVAAIEECLDSGLLLAERGMLAFRHELARGAVEQSLSEMRAQRLHAGLLASLEAGRDGIPLARRVHHADRAGDAAAVLRMAPAAAREAQRRGAHREAAAHYRSALAYADAEPPSARAELYEQLSYEAYLTGQIEEALAARKSARALWREIGDRLREGDTVRWLSRLSWYNGRTADAEVYADEAIALLEPMAPGRETAMAYSNHAQLDMLQGRRAEAIAWGEKALALAASLGDGEIESHALNNIGVAKLDQDDATGLKDLQRSLELALASRFEEHAARAYVNLSFDAVTFKRYGRALELLRSGIEYCDGLDLDAWGLYMSAYEAEVWFGLGEWDRAADSAARVLQASNLAPISRIVSLTVRAQILTRRGEDDGVALLEEALQLALPTASLLRAGPVLAARLEAARLRGDLAAMLADAEVAGRLEDRSAYRRWICAEIAYQLHLADLPPQPPDAWPEPYALQLAGRWEEAAAAWQALGCRYEQARALSEGDDDAQRTALAIFEALGANAMAAFLRRKMRRDGVRGIPRGQRASTQSNPLALTAREIEILRLVCAGLRNAQIAAKLSRSVRTVDHHVSAIFAKLGVATRTEATAAARAAGIALEK